MRNIKSIIRSGFIAGLLIFSSVAFGQKADSTKKEEVKKHWYDLLSIRGYTQVRYHGLVQSNENLKCEQCDKAWDGNGGFSIRRARLVVSGDVTDRLYVYIQTDLANTAGNQTQFLQIRDLYGDVALDAKKEFRFRIGQSKVPFGFDNMQSSQNRLAFDRSDAVNSSCPNERDLGVFFMWAPKSRRDMFKDMTKNNLKGTGDYGVVTLGIYNGQSMNKLELNKSPHVVGRVSWPQKIGNKQVVEAGVNAFMGKFVIPNDLLSAGVKVAEDYKDQRYGAAVVLYPQPFGLQAEYIFGTTPRFNPVTDSIEASRCSGFYATASYRMMIKKQYLIPYYRYQQYDGGKKHELDARSYHIQEHEIGVEWQPFPALEITAAWLMSDRRFEDFVKQDNRQTGNSLRLQVQFNY